MPESPTRTSRVNDLVKFSPLATTEAQVNGYIKTLKTAFHIRTEKTRKFVSPLSFVGIEIELENMENALGVHDLHSQGVWRCVGDGSLRNNGYEYVSTPLRGNNIYYALQTLIKDILNKGAPEFSERTSVHVHVDVRQLTLDNIMSFILIYTTVEKLLYMYIQNNKNYGGSRYENIYCSPIETSMHTLQLPALMLCWKEKRYREFWMFLYMKWHKYAGMNLLPIKPLGTIEFRQAHGTLDLEFLTTWINLLLCIKRHARKTSVEDLLSTLSEINTNSQYNYFLDSIFGEHAGVFESFNSASHIEMGVINVKSLLMGQAPKETVDVRKASMNTYIGKGGLSLI